MATDNKRPRGSKQTNDKQPAFEEAFVQLRETVEALERGGLTLDEATRLFDNGMRLAKTCNELLTAAELKITRLQRNFGQQMAMVQEEPEDEDGEPAEEVER